MGQEVVVHNVILLAIEYFKIGCVSIGGGLTVVPFLYYFVEKYHWYSANDITQMLAVSNLTPGPIGINMATFVGLKVGGILGATLTTIAFMIPSFVIMYFVAKFLKNNNNNPCMCCVLESLRPAAVALISIVGFKILNATVLNFDKFSASQNITDLISIKAVVLLVLFLCAGIKLRKQPMWLIVIAIVVGILIYAIESVM